MTLLETFAGETDAELRAAIDAILQSMIPDKLHWWHPYEWRGSYECRGRRFRHFYCIAGSVECWLWMNMKKYSDRRMIVCPSRSVIIAGPIKIEGCGEEIVISRDEIHLAQFPDTSPDID